MSRNHVFAARPRARGSLLSKLVIVSTLALTAACGARARGPTIPSERVSAPTLQVSEDAFAGAVHDLLVSEPGSQERAVRLAGVEARQMARALSGFKAHAPDRGVSFVLGGLGLMRTGELGPTTLGPYGVDALKLSVKEIAHQGDEARARALYEILNRTAPAAERTDAQLHLDAIATWTRDVAAKGGPVHSAGMHERLAVRRRLIEPSNAALDEALAATTEWIRRAQTFRTNFQMQPFRAPREETAEVYRALQTGGVVLVALALRDADAVLALRALDNGQARDLVPPDLTQALEGMADGATAARWLDLYGAFRQLSGRDPRGEEEDEFVEDRDLFQAAAFACAREAYRLEPSNAQAAATVAAGLLEHGMAEATPAVLTEAAKAHPEPRTVSGALTITLHAMNTELEAGDVDAVRRTYRAAGALLALGDSRALLGRTHPSPARVRARMADVELREGRPDEAQALLKASVAAEKVGSALLSLARIEWHAKESAAAIHHLTEALTANDTERDGALRGEILLTMSDITREQGDVGGATKPLVQALRDLAQARQTRDPENKARAERVLSRVLDRFGASQPAQRALDRAFEAAPRNRKQASATVALQVSRAFLRGDLPGARDGLSRGIAAELSNDELVALALWVRLLERQVQAPSEGTASRIFKSIPDDGSWASKLSLYGLGKIKGEDLAPLAKTPPQKTEAAFFAAMDRRLAGDTKGADEALKLVVSPVGVQLVSVAVARELLSGSKGQGIAPLPSDVALP